MYRVQVLDTPSASAAHVKDDPEVSQNWLIWRWLMVCQYDLVTELPAHRSCSSSAHICIYICSRLVVTAPWCVLYCVQVLRRKVTIIIIIIIIIIMYTVADDSGGVVAQNVRALLPLHVSAHDMMRVPEYTPTFTCKPTISNKSSQPNPPISKECTSVIRNYLIVAYPLFLFCIAKKTFIDSVLTSWS